MPDPDTSMSAPLAPDWVDEVLLAGPDAEVCLHIGGSITRAELRRLVADRQERLAAAGLGPGGLVALCLPPSLAFVANLLAVWRTGAQACLLDHRLTRYETDQALERLRPTVVVAPVRLAAGGLRAFHEVDEVVTPYPGGPATTGHAVLQLSSGSTGPSKVIGRTAADLVAEVTRYTHIDGVPRAGERIVLLASMVHVLGLVGGLLYGLHAHVELVLPERVTGDSILAAVAAGPAPTTVLGVPFHIELLASVSDPPPLPQLTGMTTGGELIRGPVREAFVHTYGVRLGNMYGMTEVGVIATDLFWQHWPSLAPAPGIRVGESPSGELLIGLPASPYVGLSDPTRFAGGWLHTRDAGRVDPATGLITVLGRLDSQVSVGGLKVDLTEVEQTIAALPDVAAAVVVYDQAIEAYVAATDPAAATRIDAALSERLAPYKRPRAVHVIPQLPRTATGKLVRDRTALRAALGATSGANVP
jgi:acyl-coenzyme A synthetase/AMP-(fatty) acid ligase